MLATCHLFVVAFIMARVLRVIHSPCALRFAVLSILFTVSDARFADQPQEETPGRRSIAKPGVVYHTINMLVPKRSQGRA